MHKGYLLLLLHAHLPYIREPEHEYFLEENWLYEALIETYIPLIDLLERLITEGVCFKLTLSLSPTLLEMFNDPLLKKRFRRHLNTLIELTEREILRTRKDIHLNPLSRMYNADFKRIRYLYEEQYREDLISTIRGLVKTGRLELITTSATHAYLPNLSVIPSSVRAQLKVALLEHKRYFGMHSSGIWLPECGYYEGLDYILREVGVEFFFLERHGVLFGKPRPKYGVFKPIRSPSGVVAFGRDEEVTKEVWSAIEGYPGDPLYRDFYKDIGFDLSMKYIKPFLKPDGLRRPLGIKYWCITGKTDKKKPYLLKRALKKAKLHAEDFLLKRQKQLKDLKDTYNFTPLVTAPYDAELFGHWWFEGIKWLEFLLRGLSSQGVIMMTTPSEYLSETHNLDRISPSMSSWGNGGYGCTWCSINNNWALRYVHTASRKMEELVKMFLITDSTLIKRALNQALRELLLMQASDWLFMIESGTAPHYGKERLLSHIRAFERLYEMIKKGRIDKKFLEDLEQKNKLFPFIDYRLYYAKI